jgi:hypothetical protein
MSRMKLHTPVPKPEPPAANTWHDWLLVPPPEVQVYGEPGPIIDAWVKKYDPATDTFRYFRIPDLHWRDKYSEWTNLPKDVRPVAWMRVEGPSISEGSL